ncbi:hypothetical protein V1283_004742 [Bradyrhizobium sp. AZCC 2262]|uniref:hypothetical protein n=1 Tax=Bradyrhizobium sp. AZCC 2262 TaxID=3117022 RepID=UPI002FF3F709
MAKVVVKARIEAVAAANKLRRTDICSISPLLISHFRDWRRILPSHVAKVQPPRKHHYPAPHAGLRGGAAMARFTIRGARKHVNFRSAGWRN